jgi:hypothetical protein
MKLSLFLALFLTVHSLFDPFLSAIGLKASGKIAHKNKQNLLTSAPTVTIGSQSPGATPFINQINITVSPANALKSVQFTVTPKPGSVTRPISATYTSSYLQSRGDLNTGTGIGLVPVFGLYANYTNTATLKFLFTDGSSQQNVIQISTADWTDPCGQFKTPIVVQARTSSTSLSYDYMIVKTSCGSMSPLILDTDGAARWIGATNFGSQSSMFFANGFYIGDHSSGNLYRMEFDGSLGVVHDFGDIGVTGLHHNVDPGKQGMLLEVDTTTQTESVILEVDSSGNLLKTWNFADIISQAMTAGGDNPAQFVGSGTQDWFHNNAATYRKSDDSLIVSSRESFVICIDYETNAIKWILGDTTKKWYQFASLRQYALALGPNTLPPIGQHAVSISKDDDLLLFDNGLASSFQNPPGSSRFYSAPRKYHIDLQAKTATEVWNYPNVQSLYSRICSSIYEDDPLDYLIDYADITNISPPAQYAGILGLDSGSNKVFDYRYTTSFCSTAWNSIPIHLNELVLSSVIPLSAGSRKAHGSAGTSDVNLPLTTGAPSIECRSGDPGGNHQVVVTFATPVSVTNVTATPSNGGTASISGSPTVNGNQVTVNLSNVSNAQTVTINLLGVSDGTNTDDISVRVSFLAGDTTGNGITNSSDISQTQSQSGQPVTAANFREDVTANGLINSSDIGFVQANSGTALP